MSRATVLARWRHREGRGRTLRVPRAFIGRVSELQWKEVPPSGSGESKLWAAAALFGHEYFIRQIGADFVPDTRHRAARNIPEWNSERGSSSFYARPKRCNTLKAAKISVSQFLRDELVATAYHEAGHVVSALLQNIALSAERAATIEVGRIDRHLYAGYVFTTEGKTVLAGKGSRETLEKYCVNYLCGRAADIVVQGRWSEMGVLGPGGSDYASVNVLLKRLTAFRPKEWSGFGLFDDELKAYLLILEFRAARLVKENWHTIERLACALLSNGTLSTTEARRIAGVPK